MPSDWAIRNTSPSGEKSFTPCVASTQAMMLFGKHQQNSINCFVMTQTPIYEGAVTCARSAGATSVPLLGLGVVEGGTVDVLGAKVVVGGAVLVAAGGDVTRAVLVGAAVVVGGAVLVAAGGDVTRAVLVVAGVDVGGVVLVAAGVDVTRAVLVAAGVEVGGAVDVLGNAALVVLGTAVVGDGVVLGRFGAMKTRLPLESVMYSSPPPLPETVSLQPVPAPYVPELYRGCVHVHLEVLVMALFH